MWVYIIYSKTADRYYTGLTSDLKRRLKEHNKGRSGKTRKGIPWELMWKKQVGDRNEAAKLEKTIKKRGAGRFLKDEFQN